jgi:HEAT repeat protein
MDLPSDMRSWAVEQLGHGPTEHAVGPLVDLLADADPVVVRTAARALAGHDDPRVRPALEQLAQHEAPDVRRVAERALSSLR